MACRRRQPDWWRQVAYSGTKLLYQPEPKPVVYIVPVKNILGRLALVPYGEHGTIPYDWHALQRSHYPRGVCDARDRPGSGSRLFYINSWAMIWSSDHARSGRDGNWAALSAGAYTSCFYRPCKKTFWADKRWSPMRAAGGMQHETRKRASGRIWVHLLCFLCTLVLGSCTLCIFCVLWCTLCSLVHFMFPETLKQAYLGNQLSVRD